MKLSIKSSTVTRVIRGSVTSSNNTDLQSEYEYRRKVYLARKHEFETLGEQDNNDVLSREDKMNIAKAEMDKVAPKSDKSAKDATFKTDKRLSPTSIAWNDLEFSEQLKLMKDYVTRYNGTKIFEDFADYVGQDVFDIVDCFSDAEYRGDIRVPQSKQSESEFANDDIYSSSDIVTL